MSLIKFGTSGWRAPIADDFTAADVYRLTQAVASHVLNNKDYGFEGKEYNRSIQAKKIKHKKPLVIVGYDTRFMSEHFARIVAQTLASNAIAVKLSAGPVPTPVVAWSVLDCGAVGGVTITASEGPSHVNGYHWTPFWGGSATEEVTADIEKRTGAAMPAFRGTFDDYKTDLDMALVELADLRKSYFAHMKTMVNTKAIRAAGLKVAVDALYGAVGTYLRPLLEDLGVKTVGLHEGRDVLFGGRAPYTGPDTLAELSACVKANKMHLGVACTSDGDRFGIVDSEGSWISPNEIIALVIDHMVKNRKMSGRVCRNVFTSNFVDLVARTHGLQVRETKVGFNHIGELMRTGQYMIGGEESGGLSIQGHVPEKDGMLACLLVIEMIACSKKPLKTMIAELYKRYGELICVKKSVPLGDVNVADMTERLQIKPPLGIGGFSVWRIDQTDGFKFILRDGSWLGLRPSSNEPIVRIYAEATSRKKLDVLVEEGKKIIGGKF